MYVYVINGLEKICLNQPEKRLARKQIAYYVLLLKQCDTRNTHVKHALTVLKLLNKQHYITLSSSLTVKKEYTRIMLFGED